MSQLLRMYDDSGDGRITFDEFVEIVADLGFHGNYEGTGLRTSNIEWRVTMRLIDACPLKPWPIWYIYPFFIFWQDIIHLVHMDDSYLFRIVTVLLFVAFNNCHPKNAIKVSDCKHSFRILVSYELPFSHFNTVWDPMADSDDVLANRSEKVFKATSLRGGL